VNESQPTAPRPAASARRRLAVAPLLAAVLVAGGVGTAAFAQGGTSTNNSTSSTQCRRLQDTQYWPVSNQIAPMPSPVPNRTQAALDGFVVNPQKNADGTITIDIERQGRSDNETNEKADQDDIKVDVANGQKLYFLEGEMGDDAVGIDTHLNDEAVVLTDANGCILK
jgi:hypothetical protein